MFKVNNKDTRTTLLPLTGYEQLGKTNANLKISLNFHKKIIPGKFPIMNLKNFQAIYP